MSSQKTVLQRFGTVEDNELRLDTDRAEQIVEALNTDIASLYVLYHQLKKHHWNVSGAEFRDIHLFLDEAAENAEDGIDELAERTGAIGGTPIAGAKAAEEYAPVEPEDEDVYEIRTSLEHDLVMYGDIVESVRDHVELATNFGDHATAELLRGILVDLEEDAHHIEHFLDGDTLVTENSMR
ncbi:MAG: DNA-binding ferritin-like protein, oxidative damage protectant [halophilic archaeon J07HX64]|jgi:DNA-binding ferritin-like protein (oxidative damage protectant)|nr:MAG: DNA-binding ferritin-like protein, oxidative damage protectant [halophilic archaeon J07HX64]